MTALVDPFNRRISYLRLSVTDRCDLRCVYCMSEKMQFLPRHDVLSLEELARIARVFVGLGVQKIRLTGGEPLVRQNLPWLVREIAGLPGLRELAMTSNGTHLAPVAAELKKAGLGRLNISLDSLQAARFREITRVGNLDDVLAGLQAARAAGFRRIKLNSVILRGRNDDEVEALVAFARDQDCDISFIEEMPLGAISEHDRAAAFMPSDEILGRLAQRFELLPSTESTGGPSRYYRLAGSDTRVGFISPHSHNFCASCNRVRVTVEGRLLLCLGNEDSLDLRRLMREEQCDDSELRDAIVATMALKPERHHFDLQEDQPRIVRFMNMTGG
ncbi:MAG: moaA [Moraxellaceae bacterium]|jgi:cyclic pyranopterin phosphate synthase|nr:moaA [Moraxellaceae bacterium]